MCAFWVLIQKILKKDPPFLFFPLVGGGCGNACVCVCVCKAFCVDCLSVFACEATKSKNLRWRAPRDGKDDARTHTTQRERERVPTLRCCISVGTTRVCVRARVCSDVPFAVDFSLSQIGKMVLALFGSRGLLLLLFAATERENTTNGKQAGDKHTKTTTTCDTRHAHLYNTQKAFVCYIICVIIMSHALCVLNKRGGRKRKREKGGKPENNNNKNMMEIHTSKPSKSKLV